MLGSDLQITYIETKPYDAICFQSGSSKSAAKTRFTAIFENSLPLI